MSKKKHQPPRSEGSKRKGHDLDSNRLPIFEETRHFITVSEAARMFDVSRQTLYRWMEWEENPFPKPMPFSDNISRLSVAQIRRWVERCQEANMMQVKFADYQEDGPGAA